MTYYDGLLKYNPRLARMECRTGRANADSGCSRCVTNDTCVWWKEYQEADKQINLKVFINDIGMIEIKRVEG